MALTLNPFQPTRPTENPETKERLMYRTYPLMNTNGGRLYRSCYLPNMITQVQLYRWTFSDTFAIQVGIADLHDYLVGNIPFISKRHLGGAVINALSYNARKLKGASKFYPKTAWTYVFYGGALELRYGLEWMICAWYRRFLIDQGTRESDLSTPEQMLMELDLLGQQTHAEYVDFVLGPLRRTEKKYQEPNWKDLMRAHGVDSHVDTHSLEMSKPKWIL